jgi:outer membrane protein assembly factor BamD (BamD/ComL family)
LWKTLDLVTIVDDKNVEECHRSKNDYVYVKEKHKKYANPDLHWFKAGSKMLARKDYENAKKCFANIKRNDLV